jgi:recombination protein RecT
LTSTALVQLEWQFEPLKEHIRQVLPRDMAPDRLIRTVLISCERNPRLLECNRQSLFNAALSAAVLGLECDGVTGQAFLIPFKDRVQLVIGYKGFNTLAARSGITITGAVVREGDKFEYELGSKGFVRHRPEIGNKGRIIAAWAVGRARARPAISSVLGIDEILAIKQRAPGAQKHDSPWNDPAIGFPAMAEKSAKRRLARAMPLNVMQSAAALDEAFEERGKYAWVDPDRGVQIEGEAPQLVERNSQTPTAQELLSTPSARPAAHTPGSMEKSGESPSGPGTLSLEDMAREAAQRGEEVFNLFYNKRTAAEKRALQNIAEDLRELMKEAE